MNVIRLIAVTAIASAVTCGGTGSRRSGAMERNDPNREKTPADLERMAAAQRKRDRKQKRKN